MTKASGLGAGIAVDDSSGTPRTISNDITNWGMATPRGVQEITGVDKSAIERLLLLADFTFDPTGVWNSSTANQAHDVFKTVPSTSVARTVTITVNSKVLAGELLFTDYSVTRSNSGELTWSAPGVLADGTVPTWA